MSSSPWTLCVCVLTCLLSCSVPEDTQVRSGEDVLLLCQGPRGADIILVKWIRPDLETELYVFFFRAHRTYINYQHPYFRGRVKLRDPQRKEGDASVILENVTINDTGTYECHVRNKGNRSEFVSSVQLQVKDSDQQITVKTGDDVTLQCLDPRGGDIELLEWMRRDLNVFVWKHGKMSEDDQHESFKNRVELRDPQMKNGDVSLIVKNVTINDTGTYECSVRNSNTQPQPQSICNITLTVRDSDPKVKTVHPREDVLLRCQGPRGADIVFVKYIRPDLESEDSVFFFRDDHTYENYQHPSFHGRVKLRDPQIKDGDVSVILKNVNIKDTGTYECYVGIKGNRLQLISRVHLQVKDSGGGAGRTGDGGDKDGGDKDGGEKGGGDKGGRVGLIVALSAVTVLLVAAAVVFMIYRKHKILKKKIHQPPVNKGTDHELQDLTSEPKEKLKEEEPPVET